MAGVIADESIHDPDRGFSGGYYMETISLGPAFMASFVEPGGWGPDFAALIDRYLNTAGMWIVGHENSGPEGPAEAITTWETAQVQTGVKRAHRS